MANLRNRFDQESTILETLFGKLTDQQWARLDFIYLKTEQDWNNTFKKIPDGIIRYLLICEAPPWSESGNINYVYNPSTPISAFLREPAKAFLGEGYHSGLNRTRLIEKLCRYGFMLVDSIPFAMNYSKNKRRDTDTYSQLVSMTVDSYLQEKLEDDRIKFAKDIKIAFALRKNADVISTHYSNNFPLASHGINSRVTENICTNAANYPCAERLREIFKLKNQLRTQRNSLAETDNL